MNDMRVLYTLEEAIGKAVSGVGYYPPVMIIAFTDGSVLRLEGVGSDESCDIEVRPSAIDTGEEEVGYALQAAGLLTEAEREEARARREARLITEQERRREENDRREYDRLSKKFGKASADLWTKK